VGTSVIKVVVADDSGLMVRLLSEIIQSDPELQVVGTASHGYDAVRKVRILHPDVVTMDVNMPRMNGLKAVEHIMRTMPTPIVMISSLTQEGAEATIKALDLGAIDFVPKPSGYVSLDIGDLSGEIIAKIKMAAKIRVIRTVSQKQPFRASGVQERGGWPTRFKPARHKHDYRHVVAIGCSTGGPQALSEILQQFPSTFPAPILVVQHMPEKFTQKLAEMLDRRVALHVVEAGDGMDIQRGMVYIAPGANHIRVRADRTLALQAREGTATPCPSVDLLMISVAEVFGEQAIGVLLTGMGNDGVIGMNAIKNTNGVTIAQDEDTSLVFGMPRMAIESGCIDSIVPLGLVPKEIMNSLRIGHD
jgi:two-component system, chemotaxis family, protein-glutamate methylesterase/glutaminase